MGRESRVDVNRAQGKCGGGTVIGSGGLLTGDGRSVREAQQVSGGDGYDLLRQFQYVAS